MYTVLLVAHTLLALALIIIILFQRSSSDGMGLSGGGNSVLSGRGQANLVTHTTAILAISFILISLALGYLIKQDRGTSLSNQLTQSVPVQNSPADIKNQADALEKKPVSPKAAKEQAPAPARVPTSE